MEYGSKLNRYSLLEEEKSSTMSLCNAKKPYPYPTYFKWIKTPFSKFDCLETTTLYFQ